MSISTWKEFVDEYVSDFVFGAFTMKLDSTLDVRRIPFVDFVDFFDDAICCRENVLDFSNIFYTL